MVPLSVPERISNLITGPIRTVKLARKLRSEMTMPELILWRVLRTRPGGLKFRRQHPAGVYVLDFYCAAARLAIEVDGLVHDGAVAAERDADRTAFLKSQHVAVMRVPAKAVFEDLEAVVVRIVDVCVERAGRIAELRAKQQVHSPVPLHHAPRLASPIASDSAAHGPPLPSGEE
jgi:very-short-patch-repair endonuclease